MTILVTGSSGQLGQSIESIASEYSNHNFIYRTSKELDISNEKDLRRLFSAQKIDWCINCAAYTFVDKAEHEKDNAYKINAQAVGNLAFQCEENGVKLIHISTDFVFDGSSLTPYTEISETNPLSVYGMSKLEGELLIQEVLKQYYIIRTSWLYSEFGSNFVKTILRISNEKNRINVVDDQIGSPTYARDLSIVILKLIEKEENMQFGVYNYSNEGAISWCDFAKEIVTLVNAKVQVQGVSSNSYKSIAHRPLYSVLNKEKIKAYLQIEVPYWTESLKDCIINKLD